jgi:hypothetical protein
MINELVPAEMRCTDAIERIKAELARLQSSVVVKFSSREDADGDGGAELSPSFVD